MSPLYRKLGRELWQMRGQALAIALVIASGVMTFVITSGTLDSLRATQARFYGEYRFAQIFASLTRAPEHLVARIGEIDGVRTVESRVVSMVNVDVEGFADPVSGMLVSLPDRGEAALNRVWLREGRMPEDDDEVVLGESFADAHGFAPGGRLAAVINGRWQRLRITGIGSSPEFVFQVAPGELFFDFERFGVMWMRRQPLATAFDLDGAFNNLVLTVSPGASQPEVIARLDDLLARYGGQGAHGREDQASHSYLEQEFQGLQAMVGVFPVVFFGVAAFLLNVVIARLLAAQREQVGILKAFGYSNAEVGWHYAQLVLVIVLIGGVIGIAAGAWLGRGMANLYMEFYRFPYLEYRINPRLALTAVGLAAIAALAGTAHAVLRAARLPPAEAMRAEPPGRFRRTLAERVLPVQRLDQASRMILRHIGRHPLKSALTVLGIAMSVAILMLGRFQTDVIDHLIEVHFGLTAREDITVTFVEPTSYRALFELQAHAGVGAAEPMRSVPARLNAGHREHRLAIQGLIAEPRLHRLLDSRLRPIAPPTDGLLLTDYLAASLGVGAGDWLDVEVLEGERPMRRLQVSGVVAENIGMNAYMHLDALNRMMREGHAISGVYLQVDRAARERLFQRLKEMPRVAGVTIQSEAINSFREDMAETVLIFTFVITLLAVIIAVGVVYNSARIALAERGRELASLRVLGYRRAEVAYILLGELALLTLLALPPGFAIGYGLTHVIAAQLGSEIFRVPAMVTPATYAFSAIVVLLASIASGMVIRRRLQRMDIISVLKTRE